MVSGSFLSGQSQNRPVKRNKLRKKVQDVLMALDPSGGGQLLAVCNPRDCQKPRQFLAIKGVALTIWSSWALVSGYSEGILL
jgi:hypothetical protein